MAIYEKLFKEQLLTGIFFRVMIIEKNTVKLICKSRAY
jgi:hypothetical protein